MTTTGLAQRARARSSPRFALPPLALRSAAVNVTAAAAWGLFAAYRIWRTVAGPPWVWQDSRTYIAAARAPLLSVAFLSGPRSPVVPLLWKLTGTPERYVVTQTVIAVAAWTVLAWTVARRVRSGWPAVTAGITVLAFSSCWQVLQWDWSVLSESISLSAVAVIVASTIWLTERFSFWRAATLVTACVIYEGARDQAIWIVALAGASLILYPALTGIRGRGPGGHRLGLRVSRGVLALGLVMLSFAGLAEASAAHAQRNVINVEDVFNVRVFPFPARVAWFARHGMPQAAALDQLAAATPTPSGQAKVVGPDLTSTTWAPLNRWFDTRGETALLLYFVSHPAYDLTAPFQRPQLTYNNADGNLAFYGDINNGTRTFLPVIPAILFPSRQTDTAIAIGAVSLLVARRYRPCCLPILVNLAGAGLLSMLIAWQGDGMEIARHTVEGNVQTRVAVLIVALLALLPSRAAPSKRRPQRSRTGRRYHKAPAPRAAAA